MANDVLHETGRQAGAETEVPELHQRRGTKTVSRGAKAGAEPKVNWPAMTILLMQMQEHVEALSRQGLEGEAARELDGLRHCSDELLPTLLAEARKQP